VFAIFNLGGGEIVLGLTLVLLFAGARPAFDKQLWFTAITLVLVAALGFTVLACLR
jgi:hypothetical protein